MSHTATSVEYGAAHTQPDEAPSLERASFNMKQDLDSRGVAGSDIDKIDCIDYRLSGGKHGPLREHLLLAINRGLIRDVVWYTPPPLAPVDEQKPLTIVTKPGLGEIIEDGVGWQFHKEMSNRNPYAKIVTHATEGFGPSAQHCSIMELSSQGLDSMAEHGRELLHTYFNDERLAFVATSMGTVIVHKLLVHNRQGATTDQLQVAANINYAPALVDPENIVRDMLFKFPGLMIIDGLTEVVARTSPQRLFELCETLLHSKPSWRDIPPILRQIVDLLKGVSEDEIRENSARYNTATIVGKNDPVGQEPMWQRMPVLLHVIKGRGHGMAVKPREGAIKSTATLHELNAYRRPITPTEQDQLAA